MTGEIYIGIGIGTGALAGSWLLNAKWEAYKRKLAESYGVANRNEEEMAIGRLALITRRAMKPDFDAINQRLAAIEAAIAGVPVGASNEVEEPEVSYNWKEDGELRKTAREVVDALTKMGQKKADAEAMVLRAVERQTGPGASFDILFAEAFKK